MKLKLHKQKEAAILLVENLHPKKENFVFILIFILQDLTLLMVIM